MSEFLEEVVDETAADDARGGTGELVVGTLLAIGDDGTAVVSWREADCTRVTSARSLPPLSAHHAGRDVVLAFEGGDLERPLVLGLLRGSGAAGPASTTRLDFERLEIVAREGITLACGRSRITLDREGRVVTRGERLLARASADNRIQGGSVHLN